jgi:MFS family permease
MERVDVKYRAMVASLASMAHQFGWAFSPTISGFLQVRYGFKPAFMVTIAFYLIAISMYYLWFWKNRRVPHQEGSSSKPGDSTNAANAPETVNEGTA